MNLAPIEDALRAWVKTATGLPDGQVYFANQNGPQPGASGQLPFVTILVAGDVLRMGALDEFSTSTNLAAPAGQEITQATQGPRDLAVSVQAFGEGTITKTGVVTAPQLLAACQTALGLESVRYALNAAGLAPYDMGEIRRLDEVVETGFQGRATLDLRFYSGDYQSETNGYINEVSGTGTLVEPGLPNRSAPFDVKGP